MKLAGLYRGVVVNATDPMARGRLQVSVPSVGGNVTVWAERCQPLGTPAGARGTAGVGSDVWVAFEGGDMSFPVVMGRRG